MMIGAGQLNRSISIEEPKGGQTSDGQSAQSWHCVLQCWAKVETLKTEPVYALDGLWSETLMRFTIRYPDIKITQQMRIQYAGRLFGIQAAEDPDECHEELVLVGKETV